MLVYDFGRGNNVSVQRTVTGGKLKLQIFGDNNEIIIDDGCRLNMQNRVYVGGSNNKLHICSNVIFDQDVLIVLNEGTDIFIGSECMFAAKVVIRSSDQHSIFDGAGKRINPSRGVHIANHVWLARGVQVMKGVSILEGSVVGAGSIVTKDIPANCLAVGNPARVVKENISWSMKLTK